jgi:hypothetical protein
MPRIFDNIDQSLLPALRETLVLSDRADFCVGYFNLRGWKQIDAYIERCSGGPERCCRLLVGMQRLPQDDLREALTILATNNGIDNQTALRFKQKLAQHFREQLMLGAPTNADEMGLRRLAVQLKAHKVIVKLFLRHPLHAKLYLLFRPDPISPTIGYLGSSNLTFAGLSHQGELNIDVVDQDACQKLAQWFEERWEDRWCIDISQELLAILEESWAREEVIPPYHIYIKMAYHLSQEARTGVSEFRLPRDFGNKLFDFQVAAVQIAAHHLNKRGGVLIGDVVGLGKTLMATAVARIFEDDPYDLETLIICPKNLVSMWEDYRSQYRMRARVLSISQVTQRLLELHRYRLVIIDESHNLRNREGKRYRAIQEYLRKNESKVILLSATPYNKTYIDLSNQLRLFLSEDVDIGIRPESLLRELGETEFIRRHQCLVINGVSLLKTELGNGQAYHVLVINVQAPPGQEIERHHHPGKAGTEVRPHAMAHFLAMEDRREHRQHRFNQHPRVPGATRTDFHIGRIAGFGMETGIREDNHLAVKLGNEGVKMRVVDVGGGTVPGTNQAPLIQDETELPAHNPPMITLPFLANLHGTAPFAHGVDQLKAIRICYPQHGRGGQKPGSPRGVGLEEARQAGALGHLGKQGQVVARHPAIAALLAVLFQHILARFPAIEVGHLRAGFLNRVKEMQHRLAVVGKVRLGVYVHIGTEVVAQRTVGVH